MIRVAIQGIDTFFLKTSGMFFFQGESDSEEAKRRRKKKEKKLKKEEKTKETQKTQTQEIKR